MKPKNLELKEAKKLHCEIGDNWLILNLAFFPHFTYPSQRNKAGQLCSDASHDELLPILWVLIKGCIS